MQVFRQKGNIFCFFESFIGKIMKFDAGGKQESRLFWTRRRTKKGTAHRAVPSEVKDEDQTIESA